MREHNVGGGRIYFLRCWISFLQRWFLGLVAGQGEKLGCGGGDVQAEGVGSVQARRAVVGVVLRDDRRERLSVGDDPSGA